MKSVLFILILMLTGPLNLDTYHGRNENAMRFKGSEPVVTCGRSGLCRKADFPIGVAVDVSKLIRDTDYRNLIVSEFNSITAEQSMKASVLHPGKDNYNFNETDFLIDFCRQHNMRLHGHTLVWYKGIPKWMEKFKGDKNAWDVLLKDHIQTVVGHCRGRVRSWDVVNEAFNDDGSLRESIWLKNMGPEYIEKAFRYAAEADPSAMLFYNDFDLESRPEKLKAVVNYFRSLKAKGVKIDGIGMQMHISITFPYLTDINLAAMQIEEAGFAVHYSEFDITMVKTGKLWMMNKHLLRLQEERIKEVVAAYKNLKPQSRFGITMWGLSDADSWLYDKNDHDRPLLFDTKNRVKPAYCGFLKGLTE
ncbi:MAG: endo,4-beta-xylanase [Bacteroidota bacterium]|jgi:endo-1,4-beta-xylanase|nr:endo,4-beta-xylanase [Bacteroidota bacterium]